MLKAEANAYFAESGLAGHAPAERRPLPGTTLIRSRGMGPEEGTADGKLAF